VAGLLSKTPITRAEPEAPPGTTFRLLPAFGTGCTAIAFLQVDRMSIGSGVQKVAIIGAGMAGLTAAALLARRGYSVDVFEANPKVGGCCATTKIDDYTFNDGALYLALPSLLEAAFQKAGLDRAALLPLRRIAVSQVAHLPDGSMVSFGEGPEVRVEHDGRAIDEPRLRGELDAFMRRWEPVLQLFTEQLMLAPFSVAGFVRRGWRHLPALRGTAAAELGGSFSDGRVRAALAGALLFMGTAPQRMPVAAVVGLAGLLRDGLYLPEGGIGRIPGVLERAVDDSGGRIHLNATVSRIASERDSVRGVELEEAGAVEADAVISTVSGMLTYGSLMDPDRLPFRTRRRVRNPHLSHRSFVLQLGLRNRVDASGHLTCVLPMMHDQQRIFDGQRDEIRWPIYSVPTVTMPELAPDGGSIIEMYPPAPQDVIPGDWSDARKDDLVSQALTALRRRHDLDVTVQRIISPKEFQQDLRLYDGAIYGLSPLVTPTSYFPHRGPLKGLYQAGQTTWPGSGVGGAALSGALAAEALLAAAGERERASLP
jgi:phytoene desaturase